jgi:hypothetical protein
LHEAQVLQAEIDPSDGAAVQHLVSAIYSTPKAVIERAKKYITSP